MRLDDNVRDVLTLFQQRKRSSVTKYQALLRRVASDGRLRDSFLYYAASTGRWSSVGINMQNLPRPHSDFKHFEDGANAVVPYLFMEDIMLLEREFGIKAIDCLASAIRGMICASKDHRFIVCDFSSVEAVVTAFLANEEHALKTFRDDGDIYKAQAAMMFRIPVEHVTEDQRFYGKIAVLAGGFAGGKGAYLSMFAQYGVDDIPISVVQSLVEQYRAANPRIVDLWGEIEGAALRAVRNKGSVFEAAQGYLKFRCSKDKPVCLQMRLPSGRTLHYWYPRVVAGKKYGNPTLEHSGVHGTTKNWVRMEAWKGVLVENAVQGIAADLQRNALLQLMDEVYNPTLQVHDEIACEMPYGEGSVAEQSEIMCRVPDWFKGLPLGADGYESKRYHK